jgi:hypothetical protein
MSTTTAMTSWLGPLGPGFVNPLDEKSRRYYRWISARCRLNNADGLKTIADRMNRPGRTKRTHRPATTRSEGRRFGDRFRDRLRISSWCLTSTDSATTERAPPGPASRTTVASTCRKRTARSRTAQCYQDRDTGEECSGILEFAMHRCALNQGVLQTLMIPLAMVMRDKLRHRPSEVTLFDRNDPVETFCLHRLHEPHHRVLQACADLLTPLRSRSQISTRHTLPSATVRVRATWPMNASSGCGVDSRTEPATFMSPQRSPGRIRGTGSGPERALRVLALATRSENCPRRSR